MERQVKPTGGLNQGVSKGVRRDRRFPCRSRVISSAGTGGLHLAAFATALSALLQLSVSVSAQETLFDPPTPETPFGIEVVDSAPMPVRAGAEPQGETILFDPHPADETQPFQINRWIVDLLLRTSAYHNDNLFLSEVNEEDDYVFTIQPGVIVAVGDNAARVENYARLSYRPTAFFFAENSSENSLDHDARFEVQYRVRRLTLGAKFDYLTLAGAERETAGRVDRTVYGGQVRATYTLAPKLDLETDLEFLRRDFVNRVDSTLIASNTFLTYMTTDRLRLGVGLTFGLLEVEGSGSQNFEQLLLKASFERTEKITLKMVAGLELRQFEDRSDRFNPVFVAKGVWTPWFNTQFQLEGYQRSRSSPTDRGSNFTETGVAVGLRQRFWQKWEVIVDVGYEHADYFPVRSDEAEERSDRYFFAAAAMVYRPSERMEVEVFSRAYQNDSSSANLSFDNSQIGVSVNLLF